MYILANPEPQSMSTDTLINQNVSAIGYAYYDDGVSLNQNITRFDFTFEVISQNFA
jgi:hypothetical protein